MTKLKTAIAVAVGSLFAGAAFAQSSYSIEQRDRAEDARIERGIESGQLTRREAAGLESERAQIERMERRARSDGVMTQNERDRITRAQDRLSRDIYRESHDGQVARSNWRSSDRPQGWDRRNEGWNRGNDTNARFGRSDLAPGRQAHFQQNDIQRNQVQQSQNQRSWTRPAQSSGTTTATNSGTTTSSGTAANGTTAASTVAQQGQTRRSWTRPAQASGTSTAASRTTTSANPVQQGQTQRSWTRLAQASTSAAATGTVARQGGYSRSATASSPVTLARQGGYSGRRTR